MFICYGNYEQTRSLLSVSDSNTYIIIKNVSSSHYIYLYNQAAKNLCAKDSKHYDFDQDVRGKSLPMVYITIP